MTGRRTPIPSEGRIGKFFHGARYWRAALAAERFDVFELLNLPVVKAPTGCTLLTIHDIRGIRLEYNLLRRGAYSLYLKHSFGAVDRVITVSETMRAQIHNVAPRVPLSVIYNGLNARAVAAQTDETIQSIRHRYQLPQRFILAVGHLEERKNYLRLVQAIAHLRDKGIVTPLVIVGNDSGLKKSLESSIDALGIVDRVAILSDLSDEELQSMYQMCSMFVFPSLYEGFGIPILEAMAAECPMALSDIPVFREITEHQGVYFPATDARAMANAIEKVLATSNERAHLVEYGRQRVDAFNFSNLAAQLETVYRSLVQ